MENSSFNSCEVFKAVTNMMAETYARKNHDYGNAYTELRKEYPDTVLIYMTAKLKRLKTLMQGEPAQVNESIEDTLLDIANYAVMEIVERNRDMHVSAESASNANMISEEPHDDEYIFEKNKHMDCRGRLCRKCTQFEPNFGICMRYKIEAKDWPLGG